MRSLFFCLAVMGGCEEIVDSSETTTAEELCDTIGELCGDEYWGFGDAQTCYDNFIGSVEYSSQCLDESGYFSCAAVCLDEPDCDTFSDCEAGCWDVNCL